ncbi:MAG: hypothetical protein IT343_11640 [Candidatus Melainabacteria bacterium]|nr:hypothetical protein [Candidatus Melainabacteria bacterium]
MSFLIGTLSVALTLSACSRSYTGADGSSVTVSGDGTKISVKSGDGSTTVNGSTAQDYPSDFPVPQYPGSKISTNMAVSSTADNAGGTSGQKIIMLNTTDGSAQVVQFYKEKLKADGWTIDTTVDQPGVSGYIGASKGSSKLNVAVIPGTPDTCISLTLQ